MDSVVLWLFCFVQTDLTFYMTTICHISCSKLNLSWFQGSVSWCYCAGRLAILYLNRICSCKAPTNRTRRSNAFQHSRSGELREAKLSGCCWSVCWKVQLWFSLFFQLRWVSVMIPKYYRDDTVTWLDCWLNMKLWQSSSLTWGHSECSGNWLKSMMALWVKGKKDLSRWFWEEWDVWCHWVYLEEKPWADSHHVWEDAGRILIRREEDGGSKSPEQLLSDVFTQFF